MKILSNYFKRVGVKPILVMLLGNVFLSMGVSIFKFAHLGNDAYNAMVMALADCSGMAYGHFYALFSIGFLIVQFLLGKKYIGIGTVVNCFLNGYITSFWYYIWVNFMPQPGQLTKQIGVMLIGILICAMGVSMYQMSDVGTSPYDSMSLILAEKFTKISYMWWRLLTDGLCVLVAYLAGGLIGIGVLAAAFCLGPFIVFFNKNLTAKLLK